MSENEKAIYGTYLEGERVFNYGSVSGIEHREFYDRLDLEGDQPPPGDYPFTRGIHRNMYRGRFWTRRQKSGLFRAVVWLVVVAKEVCYAVDDCDKAEKKCQKVQKRSRAQGHSA